MWPGRRGSVCMHVFVCCMGASLRAVPQSVSWQSSRGSVGFHHAVYSQLFTVSEVREGTWLCVCECVGLCVLAVCACCCADVFRLWCKAHRDTASPCRGKAHCLRSALPLFVFFLSLFSFSSSPPKQSLKRLCCKFSQLRQHQRRIIAPCLSIPFLFGCCLFPLVCLLVPLSLSSGPSFTSSHTLQHWLSKTDDPSLWHVCVCVFLPGVGRPGSNLMLLIPPNEHNLEGRLSSYICWLDDWGEEWRVSERGGKSCAVVSHWVRSLYQAAVPYFSVYCSVSWMEETES